VEDQDPDYEEALDFVNFRVVETLLDTSGPAAIASTIGHICGHWASDSETDRQKELWTYVSQQFNNLSDTVQRTLEEFALEEPTEHEI
jgi:hypothetical protein